ncbi:trimethylguanosine synthase-like isoform X2 [Daktulosphaira vitifoliae]|uniref:trimethylguanosine synthase-like isoform X2 n=1 Tax=Daktulosphaira vitifoliae TaxID=58002 RepID=UPI0021A9A748|nr:trimethylguanosine synthase-like isoform X2 [Daktulosphaira vitifoliae]
MNYVTLSSFSLRTEKLVEVLYKPKNCSSKEEITMLCSRVLATYRNPCIQNKPLLTDKHDVLESEEDSENEIELFSNMRKLSITDENTLRKVKQSYSKDLRIIITSLQDIGFIVIEDKMYTAVPSEIFYYRQNYKFFCPSRNVLPSKFSYEHQNTISRYADKKLSKHVEKSPWKYWSMRHLLFSKFDSGILLDSESFYSVCPEILSYHIAKRCKCDVAMDPFCGAGGNIIQLAKTCKLVIAIDIDPHKIKLAKHNAEVYGVAHKIEFIVGDFFILAKSNPKLKADVIFMSPPWGGPEYSAFDNKFSLESMCDHHFGGGYGIFNLVKKIAPNIAFHMPKTTNIFECVWLAKGYGKVEIQQNIINNRLNSITAFYGEFIDVTDDEY